MDTSHKSASLLGKSLQFPSIGGLAPNTPVRWSPFGALHRAQDTVLVGGPRVVVDWTIGGDNDWQQPNGTASPGTDAAPVGVQVYPLGTLWRRIGTYRVNVTPGCELRARVRYCPAGLTQKQIGANWYTDGTWASLRVGHAWTSTPAGATTAMVYRSIDMEGAANGTWGGEENSGTPGSNWTDERRKDIFDIRPNGVLDTPAVAALWSEWSSVELHLEVQGGARVLQVVIYEHPITHVQDHNNAGLKSAHAAPAGLAAQTMLPQTKPPDGATYQENRHGVTQTMQVAERQSERLGPSILRVSSWNEADANIWQQAEGNPWTTTGTSFAEIHGSGATSWSADGRGWIVAGAHAKLHRLCEPRLIMRSGAAAVVPVRVRVDGSATGLGATGTLRLQSGPYEWVDVAVTGGRGWYTATGFLQSQVYGDEHRANLMAFFRREIGTLNVYSICVDYNAWPL